MNELFGSSDSDEDDGGGERGGGGEREEEREEGEPRPQPTEGDDDERMLCMLSHSCRFKTLSALIIYVIVSACCLGGIMFNSGH